MTERIFLSPPHQTGSEAEYLQAALESNWIAPLGPAVDRFEEEFARTVGTPFAVALSSGTAALHLALLTLGVRPGDDVVVSTLTFAGSVFPIVYTGARPVLIDSEPESWNLDPDLLEDLLARRARVGRLPAAVIPVHLYGQSANMARILPICQRWGVPVIEDAAEALGATCEGRPAGSLGAVGIFSFNGNKIITTSGGGMLTTADERVARHVRKLATQAREPEAHYEHAEIGFNYRLSNLLAAVGQAQLPTLAERVNIRRRHFERYRDLLGNLPGVRFMPEAPWGRATRWLTVLTVDPAEAGTTAAAIREQLEGLNIEARPVWKPMHLQPVFRDAECVGGEVAANLFDTGLCLPSGSSLTPAQIDRVGEAVRSAILQPLAGPK